MTPRIHIAYNRFLDPIFTKAYLVDNPDHVAIDNDQLFKKIDLLREKWGEQESTIINGMRGTLGLEFYANAIDVHIVRSLRGGFSTPLTISILVPTERFVDTLTHELLHVLICDNTSRADLDMIWKRLYGDIEPRLTRNHVLVHAAHQDIYLNVLKDPKRLADNIKKSERDAAYKKAWEIVEKCGYRNIIDEFKDELTKIPDDKSS